MSPKVTDGAGMILYVGSLIVANLVIIFAAAPRLAPDLTDFCTRFMQLSPRSALSDERDISKRLWIYVYGPLLAALAASGFSGAFSYYLVVSWVIPEGYFLLRLFVSFVTAVVNVVIYYSTECFTTELIFHQCCGSLRYLIERIDGNLPAANR